MQECRARISVSHRLARGDYFQAAKVDKKGATAKQRQRPFAQARARQPKLLA
jgi:hypothetical protein